MNFLTYIISSLHNLTEAQTLTDRHAVMTVLLCSSAALLLCELCTATGTWRLNYKRKYDTNSTHNLPMKLFKTVILEDVSCVYFISHLNLLP